MKLYAMVTEQCNLDCPFCDIKNKEDTFNREKFLAQIRSFDGKITIFGGEPSLYPDRIRLLMPYADSITTNLLILTEELKQMYSVLGVATSWSPERFSYQQFLIWKENIKKLKQRPTLLVTLTPGVLKYEPNALQDLLDNLFENILFEQLLDYNKTEEYYQQVDKWLLNLYKCWSGHTPIINFTEAWYYDCSDIYTLYPNGILRWGCPQMTKPIVCNDCLTCELSNICKPCVLQQFCTRPKKLMEAIGK